MHEVVGSSWQTADLTFGFGKERPFDRLMSPIKLRQAGFSGCMDTEDAVLHWLSRLQDEKLIPSDVRRRVAASVMPGRSVESAPSRCWARSCARCTVSRPARSLTCVRHENPSARTTASGPDLAMAGSSCCSATATETS